MAQGTSSRQPARPGVHPFSSGPAGPTSPEGLSPEVSPATRLASTSPPPPLVSATQSRPARFAPFPAPISPVRVAEAERPTTKRPPGRRGRPAERGSCSPPSSAPAWRASAPLLPGSSHGAPPARPPSALVSGLSVRAVPSPLNPRASCAPRALARTQGVRRKWSFSGSCFKAREAG